MKPTKWVALAAAALVLAGCGSDDDRQKFLNDEVVVIVVTAPDGRMVPCAVYTTRLRGGIDCAWGDLS